MMKFVLVVLIIIQTMNCCVGSKMNQVGNDEIKDLSFIADSCKRCDIDVVRDTDERLLKLKYTDLYKFLYTFSKECSRNIEYSEYSNEILFKVVEQYPKEIMDCITKEKGLDLEYIYSELSSPLLDVNIDVIYRRVDNALGDTNIKQEILNALDKAKE